MSRGAGRIERHILAALRSDPQGAFTTDELCTRIYGEEPLPKHRSSVLRAMRKLAATDAAVAPLESVRGAGAAVYLSGSRTGGRIARAKLALLDAQRTRLYGMALRPDDEAWLTWHAERTDLPKLERAEFLDRPDLLVAIEETQSSYGLNFEEACALLTFLGYLATRAKHNPRRDY